MCKKLSLIFIVFALACTSMVTAFANTGSDVLHLFVANASENGDGSKESPFNSLENARDYIRELKSSGKYPDDGVVVNIREGSYRLEKAFQLTKEDSGKENAPVVYRSYLNEDVSFTGGAVFDISECEKVTDSSIKERLNKDAAANIRFYNLRENGINDYGELNIYGMGKSYFIMDGTDLPGVPVDPAPEVFFESETLSLARYPNNDYIKTNKIIQAGDQIEMWTDMNLALSTYVPKEKRNYPPLPSIFTVDETTKERMKKWNNAEDIWIYGFFKFDWSDVSLPVASVDAETGTVTTKYPSPKEMTANRRFYFYNLLEELDVPGEYYLDRKSGILYIYPPKEQGNVTLSLLSTPFITMDNVSDVTIKGLGFKASRNHGFDINCGNRINIELCSISKTSEYGIYFTDCINSHVTSCHIYDNGTGGIYYEMTSDFTKPYKDKLISMGNQVDNCHIENFARIRKTYSAAIEGGGIGVRYSHNKIHGSDHMALGLCGSKGIIEYNEIYDVLNVADDSGAIYGGFSKESRGAVIRNNYFYNCFSKSEVGAHGRGAVYADDLRDAVTFEQNILVDFDGEAMFANGGRNHTVQNNIMINTNGILHLTSSGTDPAQADKYSITRYNFLEYADNPAYADFPNFKDLYEDEWQAPKYNTAKNNVLWNCDESFRFSGLNGSSEGKIKADNSLDEGYIINEDPGFADAANGNYTLKSNSPLFEELPDFKAPDFMNMGMYTPHLKAKLEDSVSMMIDSPVAYSGFTPELIDENNTEVVPKLIDEKTYVPLRFLGECLGSEITYDATANSATVQVEDDLLTIDLTNGAYVFKGSNTEWDKPVVLNERTLVPLRVISEAFNKQVDWIGGSMIIVSDEGAKITDDDINLVAELKRRLSTN